MAHIHNGVLFTHKGEWNYAVCRKMNGTGDHAKWSKSDWARQMVHVLSHIQNLDLKWTTGV
jgi:hypothetical protein